MMGDFERGATDEDSALPPESTSDELAAADSFVPESVPVEAVELADLAIDVPEPEAESASAPDMADVGAEAAALAAPLEPSVSEKAKRAPRPDGYETRIEVLSLAIERFPDAAVNYVLRGEAWLGMGNRANALDDFRAALALASEAAEGARWGYVEQALADRAHEALRRLEK